MSTSDLHVETEQELPGFGKPFGDGPGRRKQTASRRAGKPNSFSRPGSYTDPLTMRTIKVAGAGCARFWIEVEFGKWLCPLIEGERLDLVDKAFLQTARDAFGMDFAQGCVWG
jgi:hypothetical protein